MKPELYHQVAEVEDSHWWYVYRRQIAGSLLKKTLHEPVRRGLDIGCGTGGNLAFLGNYCRFVFGLEKSEAALELGKKKFPRASFICGDAHSISSLLQSESIGLVTAFHVLYHEWISDDVGILKKIYDALSPGGILVSTEPAFNLLTRRHDAVAMSRKRYRLYEFKSMLQQAKFEVLLISYFNALLFLPALSVSIFDRLPFHNEQEKWNRRVEELSLPAGQMNRWLIKLSSVEKKLLHKSVRLPFGINLISINRKPK
jgi:SAM-dependent methyltransferase